VVAQPVFCGLGEVVAMFFVVSGEVADRKDYMLANYMSFFEMFSSI
jgi:hypothetical protein